MISLLLDHLWQSSLCVSGAALLVLALRRNSAAVRFWVWFAASLKFLVPFAVLTALGNYVLTPVVPPVAVPAIGLAEPFAKPFSGPTIVHFTASLAKLSAPGSQPSPARFAAPPESASLRALLAEPPLSVRPAQKFPSFRFDLESALLAIWAAGFLILATRWLVRWLRVRALVRHAADAQIDAPVPVKFSASLLEPGLVGILAPVILLPQGIAQQLSPGELKAVLAHELCHWRRHDNLLAAIHMLVEALFWFVPFVWWIGARLNAERELACDEAVLAGGNEPQIYADGILKVCRAYLQSPLACVSGISGAGLKMRIAAIMENRLVLRLNAIRKLALSASAAAALGLPVALGLLAAPVVQMQAKAAPNPSSAGQAHRNDEQAAQTAPETATAPSTDNFAANPAEEQTLRPAAAKLEEVPPSPRPSLVSPVEILAMASPDLSQLSMPTPVLTRSSDPAPAETVARNDQPGAPVAAALAAKPGCAPSAPLNSLPMEKVPGGDSMTVTATIDGKSARLLVGTGAVRTQLWHNVALKFDPTASDIASVSRFNLGSMEVGDLTILVNTNRSIAPPAFDGVLGADMMQRYDIDLDFAHRQMNYFPPEQCAGAGIYWNPRTITSVPAMQSIRMGTRAGLIYVPVMLDGHEIIALLDTGAERTYMNSATARTIFKLDAAALESGSVAVGGAVIKAGLQKFSRLTLGGLTAENPRIAILFDPRQYPKSRYDSILRFPSRGADFIPGTSPSYTGVSVDMVIGMDLLKHSHLYISSKNQRIYISAAGDGPALNVPPMKISQLDVLKYYLGTSEMGEPIGGDPSYNQALNNPRRN